MNMQQPDHQPWTESVLFEITDRRVVFGTKGGATEEQDRAAKALCDELLALSALHRLKPHLAGTAVFRLIERGFDHEITIQAADVLLAVEAAEQVGLQVLWRLEGDVLLVLCEPA